MSDEGEGGREPTVIVRFRVPGQTRSFVADQPLAPSTQVLTEGERGPRVGTVLGAGPPGEPVPAERVLRPLSAEDLDVVARNRGREREAFSFCAERIKAQGLPMKLVGVELAHSGSTAVFHFTSPDRVDFRELVRDLARRFHTRIEMRQIGVRDAARHTGGVGVCGRELCCSTWLPEFKPVSVRMAKDQGLSLHHDKLSGVCGRLKCCLVYEQSTYEEQRKTLPRPGKRVLTPAGEGRVKDTNVLKRRVRVQFADGHYEEFAAEDVRRAPDSPGGPALPPAPGTLSSSAKRRRRRRKKRLEALEAGSSDTPQDDELGPDTDPNEPDTETDTDTDEGDAEP